jgi:hypothetical protein
MSKKTVKKTAKALSPRPAVKQEDTQCVVREDLEEQLERLKRATAAAAGASIVPAPTAPAEQPPAPAKSSEPLAPLAALWPTSLPPQAKANPSQGTVPQKAPVAAPAPEASPAAVAASIKPPVQSAPLTSQEKAAVVAQAPKPTATKTVNVKFVLLDLGAKQLSLSGDFNGWSPTATPMKRNDDGHWEATVALAPGRYEYKFVVGGEWIPDPLARENVWNSRGTLNSVIEVRA